MIRATVHQSGLFPSVLATVFAGCLGVTLAPSLAAKEPATKKVQSPGPSEVPPGFRPAALESQKPADYKSAHFLVHTDLSAKEARDLLNRLERMLKLIARYWDHPPVGTIECYVVKNLSVWPRGTLDAVGLARIQGQSGITLVDSLTYGNKTVAATAKVFAVADSAGSHGVPEHEAVHAFCGQAFGNTGPLWYSEGMAEMGRYWRQDDASVHCDPHVVAYIRSSRPKPLSEILTEGSPRRGASAAQSGDSWQNYAWRWALCHLLANNTNYAARFRPLGLAFLTGQRASFADTYGSMAQEIAFEYRFFLRHLDEGYRVDLCSWDWKRKFKEPTGGFALSTRIVANRGWQPSGLTVSTAKQYQYSASGVWQTSKDAAPWSADGQTDGVGRLEGVIFHEFQLSEPFLLGVYGSFTPPSDGQLFLRCHDRWNELADNHGTLGFKIKLADTGAPLPRPAPGAAPPETADARE